jgi:DNA polymerase delta subunit 3
MLLTWDFQPSVERKPTLKLSDSEDETVGSPSMPPSKRSETQSAARARVKKGVVISDDEEEVDVPKPPRAKAAYKAKAKAAPPDPDAEKEVRAMMDIDDGTKFFVYKES